MATVELNWSELCILLRAATDECEHWDQRATQGEADGWYDDKEKDRVLTYQHESKGLVTKLTKVKKEMLDG